MDFNDLQDDFIKEIEIRKQEQSLLFLESSSEPTSEDSVNLGDFLVEIRALNRAKSIFEEIAMRRMSK